MPKVTAACLLLLSAGPILWAADPIKDKLDTAQADYQQEVAEYRKAVLAYFEEREAAARTDGNKKAVDLVKAERTTFEDSGLLPPSAPARLSQQLRTARSNMEAAYATAIQEYTRAKKDDRATATESALQDFRVFIGSALPASGTRISLVLAADPRQYLSHGNFNGLLGESPELTDELRQNRTFVREEGLAGKGTVSFRSVNFPEQFIGHERNRIVIRAIGDRDKKDFSFTATKGLSDEIGVSFEAAGRQGYYIRNRRGTLVLEKNDGSRQFKRDATFAVAKPLAKE